MAIINNEKYSLYYQRINLIYQRPEVKASLEIILSVFTVAVLVFAAIRPTLTNIAALQKKIEDLDSVNIKADNKITQVFNAQTQLTNFQNKLPLYDQAVPDGYAYYDIASRIEAIALRRGLVVQTISMPGTKLIGTGKGFGDWSLELATKNQNNIIQAEVTFDVSGGPDNIRAFLLDIENLDRLTLLKSISLSTQPGATRDSLILKASGLIYFYFYQES